MAGLRHPDWYILSEHRFRRRAAVVNTRQVFRGEPFVVLTDSVTGQSLRLTERASDVWQMFDGRQTLAEIWSGLMRRPAIAPSQGEIVDWVMQLVSSGLILSDHTLDPEHLSDRSNRQRSGRIEQRAASPLAIKVKLFDPSTLVRLTYPVAAALFTPMGGVAVLLLLVTAVVLAVLNLDELLQSADQSLLSQSGLLSLALAYPVMKAFHAMSHGYDL